MDCLIYIMCTILNDHYSYYSILITVIIIILLFIIIITITIIIIIIIIINIIAISIIVFSYLNIITYLKYRYSHKACSQLYFSRDIYY